MELTAWHYDLAKTAYEAYCKQTGGKSLATGDTLPVFDHLKQAIKDAWAASAIAIALRLDIESRQACKPSPQRMAAEESGPTPGDNGGTGQ